MLNWISGSFPSPSNSNLPTNAPRTHKNSSFAKSLPIQLCGPWENVMKLKFECEPPLGSKVYFGSSSVDEDAFFSQRLGSNLVAVGPHSSLSRLKAEIGR